MEDSPEGEQWVGHYLAWSPQTTPVGNPPAEDAPGTPLVADDAEGGLRLRSHRSLLPKMREVSPAPKAARGRAAALERSTSGAKAHWTALRSGVRLAGTSPLAASRQRPRFAALRRRCSWVIRSKAFDRLVAVVVVLNGLCTAAEADLEDEQMPRLSLALEIMEHAFALFFCLESLAKAIVFGPRVALSSGTYCFELFLAVLGAVDLWVIGPVWALVFQNKDLDMDLGLNVLPMLRVVRFLKLFRHGELGLIARCFFPAFGTMAYVTVFLFLIVFLFSIPLVRFVGQNPIWSENKEITQLFGSMPRAFFGLLQMVINPDTATMRILFEEQPWTAPFLMLFVGMTTFTTMSIIVGSVTDTFKVFSEAERAREGRVERERQEGVRRELLRILHEADRKEEGLSGALSVPEFTRQLRDPHFQEALASLGTARSSVEELLALLEVDGHVYYAEFVNGLGLLGQSAQATHVMWLRAHLAEDVRRLEKRVDGVEGQMAKLSQTVEEGFRAVLEELRPAKGSKK